MRGPEQGTVRVELGADGLPVLLAIVRCTRLADLAGLRDGVGRMVRQDAEPLRRDVQLGGDRAQVCQAKHELALFDLGHPRLSGVEQVSGLLLGEVVVLPVPTDHLTGVGTIGGAGTAWAACNHLPVLAVSVTCRLPSLSVTRQSSRLVGILESMLRRSCRITVRLGL